MTQNHTFKCKCGNTVNVTLTGCGCYNVGEAMDKTGWFQTSCGYTNRGVWLCSSCKVKAKKLANELFEITGTPYSSILIFIDKKIRDEWCEKQRNK